MLPNRVTKASQTKVEQRSDTCPRTLVTQDGTATLAGPWLCISFKTTPLGVWTYQIKYYVDNQTTATYERVDRKQLVRRWNNAQEWLKLGEGVL